MKCSRQEVTGHVHVATRKKSRAEERMEVNKRVDLFIYREPFLWAAGRHFRLTGGDMVIIRGCIVQ